MSDTGRRPKQNSRVSRGYKLQWIFLVLRFERDNRRVRWYKKCLGNARPEEFFVSELPDESASKSYLGQKCLLKNRALVMPPEPRLQDRRTGRGCSR